jgi:hypothetical protein
VFLFYVGGRGEARTNGMEDGSVFGVLAEDPFRRFPLYCLQKHVGDTS